MGRLKPLWFSLFTLTLQTSALLVFIFPIPVFAETVIPAGSNLSWNQTWTKEGSPYIIQGNVYVRFGSLTINPGTVVKVMNGAVVTLHADVHVTIAGTLEEPVIFTSFKDDSVSGDTNGDGSSSVPSPGDWGYVSIGGGGTNNNMQVQHLKVRYGGAIPVTYGSIYVGLFTASPALLLDFPWFSGNPGVGYAVDTVEVSHSADTGLLLNVGTNHSVVVSSSSFFNNHAYGVQKVRLFDSRGRDQTGTLDLSGNWWGSPTGPYHETLNPTGEGNAIAGTKLALASWLSENPFPDSLYSECCSSVVFLPGFEGSHLFLGQNELWPPTLFDVPNDLSALQLDSQGNSLASNITVGGVLEKVYGVSIYDEFIAYMNGLDRVHGNGTIKEWFPLAYDWRYTPQQLLANGIETTEGNVSILDTIEMVAQSSDTGKVTLVAHSNGGLLGKTIIKALEEQEKDNLIDSFVMVGSPQLGTPQAIGGLLHGEKSQLGNFIFTLVSKAQARALAQNMESAYNLLPSEAYFSFVTDPPVTFDEMADYTEPWRVVWGSVVGNFVELFGFLIDTPNIRDEVEFNDIQSPTALSQSILSSANEYHNEIDPYLIPNSIHTVQIAGWGLPTIKNITYTKYQPYDFPYFIPTVTSEGDGTVVYASALSSNGEKYFFNLLQYNRNNKKIDHKNILNSSPVLSMIESLIKKAPFSENSFITLNKPQVLEDESRLMVSVHSPVTLGVYDINGNFTGIEPSDQDQGVYFFREEIPNSSYISFGEGKYIIVPNDNDLLFILKGTGSGPATVKIQELSGETLNNIATFSNVLISTSTQAELKVDLVNGDVVLEIDKNADGVNDYTLTSSEPGEEVEFPKAPLSITAHSQKITLGDSLPEFSYEISGFVANETLEMSDVTGEPECLTTANANSPAGVYAITCTVGTLNSDYYRFENFIAGQLKIEYQWKGFKQPIDDPISQPGVTPSIFKAGSTVPVKFSLFDTDENIVEASVAPEWLPPIKGTALVGGVDEPVSYESATSGNLFKYDPESKQYIYNWKTKGLASGYWYHVFVRLDDGSIRTVKVGLK